MPSFRLKRPNSTTDTAIKMYCYLYGRIIAIYTGKTIHPDFWIKEDQRATENKKKFLKGRAINFELGRLDRIASDLISKIQKEDTLISDDKFRDLFEKEAFPKRSVPKPALESKTKTKLNQKEQIKVAKPEKKLEISSFFSTYDDYLKGLKVSVVRKRHVVGVRWVMHRYEMYMNIVSSYSFELSIDTITGDTIRDFEDFLVLEHELFTDFPKLYVKNSNRSKTRKPVKRGPNRIVNIMKAFRSFMIHCINGGLTANDPFKSKIKITTVKGKEVKTVITGYEIGSEKYGDPIYISIIERNSLYKFNFSKHPELEVQRDIFIFQCQIGCRVGDLYEFTYSNIINGVLHFVPGKTEDENPATISVPLNETALVLIEKYKGKTEGGKLFPFIPKQEYNDAIKLIFNIAGLTRKVMVRDSVTEKLVSKSLDSIASSHMARRTFIGGIYDKIKDPSLIGSMTGHKEGSKAFNRYRHIDDKIKRDTLKLME